MFRYIALFLVLTGCLASNADNCHKPEYCKKQLSVDAICPMNYSPVVGVFQDKYWGVFSNDCQACKNGAIKYYGLNNCDGFKGSEFCTGEYAPVCGYTIEQTGSGMMFHGKEFWKKYSNKCEYCSKFPGEKGQFVAGLCPKSLTSFTLEYMA